MPKSTVDHVQLRRPILSFPDYSVSTVLGSHLDSILTLFMEHGDASDLRMRGSPGVVLVLANCGGDRVDSRGQKEREREGLRR